MNRNVLCIAGIVFSFVLFDGNCQDISKPALQNPITSEYLKENLTKTKPRLVFTDQIVVDLKAGIQNDPILKHRFEIIKYNANEILKKTFLERIKIGKRLLSVSREMLYRINMLGVVYLMERNPAILDRINKEVLAVCSFSDWNPSHYLDVAEMSMAVAFALDWTLDDLPKTTIKQAKNALIEKGLYPSWPEHGGGDQWWVNAVNNWNQVCHGGMIAASFAVAEVEPDLAAETIKRALEKIPLALSEYIPDGVYPEGPTYWVYGTSFSVVSSEMLRSALGTDFGIHAFPGFRESANFKLMCTSPSGWYYNFADCGDKRGSDGDDILAWFAKETGDSNFYEGDRFLSSPDSQKLGRLSGASLAWMSQVKIESRSEIPSEWFGRGSNPVAIFKDNTAGNSFYLGAKGGRGELNHGNMDGGSFIFELDGVRWVVDPGVQPYHQLEKTGFDLWSSCQTCDRWKLLTKNNFAHSTITINNVLHSVNGQTEMYDYQGGEKPMVHFNLSDALDGMVKSAHRSFTRINNTSLMIEDQIIINDKTESICWQLLTTAEVEIKKGGAILRHGEEELYLNNMSHKNIDLAIVSLDPPPFELDKKIKGLKRIELRIIRTETDADGDEVNIRIQLSGN